MCLRTIALFPSYTSFQRFLKMSFNSCLTIWMPQTHLSHFSQHRANHSTETLLLRVTNDLLMACDQGSVSILSLLDLSAAFDTLDHNILLKRLRLTFGISGVVLQWLESYLTECNQTMLAGGKASQLSVEVWCTSRFCVGPSTVHHVHHAIGPCH